MISPPFAERASSFLSSSCASSPGRAARRRRGSFQEATMARHDEVGQTCCWLRVAWESIPVQGMTPERRDHAAK